MREDAIREHLDRATNVYARPVDPSYPCVMILADSDYVDYWCTFGAGGLATVRFVLEVLVGGNDPISAQTALDDYLSVGTGNGSSVVDAVMSDKTLGLTGCTVQVDGLTVDPEAITARMSVSVHIQKVGANV